MKEAIGGTTLLDRSLRVKRAIEEYKANPNKFLFAICQPKSWPDENTPPVLYPSLYFLPEIICFVWVDTYSAAVPVYDGDITFSSNQLYQHHILGEMPPPVDSELKYQLVSTGDISELAVSAAFQIYVKGQISSSNLSTYASSYRCLGLVSDVVYKTTPTNLVSGTVIQISNVEKYNVRWASTFKEVKASDYTTHQFQLLQTY